MTCSAIKQRRNRCRAQIPGTRTIGKWITSGKYFHTMRNYAFHTELIHADMRGGVRDSTPNIPELIVDYYDHQT